MANKLNWELSEACKDGRIRSVLSLIRRGANIHRGNDNHLWTPLHLACQWGHTDIALLLLDRGADINITAIYGHTPLHWACRNGHTDVALLLLGRRADINIKDIYGWTPLHSACDGGHIGTALALVRAGAYTLSKDKNYQTPLDRVESEELKAAVIREKEKYLAWTRRKAFTMFLVENKYIAMTHHQPRAAAAGQNCREPLVDEVMRNVYITIASFL